MAATNRLEKFKGITLVVQQGWATVVHDASGFEVAGPVNTDGATIAFTRIAIPVVQGLAREMLGPGQHE